MANSNKQHTEATERHRAAWNALTRTTSYYRRDRDGSAPLKAPPGAENDGSQQSASRKPGKRPH